LNICVNLNQRHELDTIAVVHDDTRGIIDPAAMADVVDFERFGPGPRLDGLVEWFWAVAWDLPAGVVHDQEVLNHPAGHISVGTVDDRGIPLDPAVGRAYPVLTGVSHRRLQSRGWTVAARSTVGGMGTLLDRPVKELSDLPLDLPIAIPGLPDGTIDDVIGAADGAGSPNRQGRGRAREPGLHGAVEVLRSALETVVDQRRGEQIDEARFVASIAALAERDRSILRVEQLAEQAGVGVRTLQRQFDAHVGVSPSFVIRRWRIIEAAEAALDAADQGSSWPGWASVASQLGYSDQAHLARDFRHHLGTTPSAYVERNRR
jgi:AraC-like DNA-binding protein